MTDNRTRDLAGAAPGRAHDTSRGEFTRRVLIVAGVSALAVSLAAVFVRASDVFFLFFLAVLLAILLRAAADALGRWTGLGPRGSLGVVAVALALLVAGGALAVGSALAGQVDRFLADFPKSVERARDYLRQHEWARWGLRHAPPVEEFVTGGGGSTASTVTSFFSTTLGVLGNLFVLTFLTLFLAASPRTYQDGLIRLVPPARRGRAGEVVRAIGFHLRWWLLGRLAAMATVAAVVGVGLAVVGVPQYLLLALIAGVLTAVPFVGPIAAAVPGVLLALVQGPQTALWAAGVYCLSQLVENYLVTPYVQQRTVSMPPALTIAAVTLVGALFGVLGLIVATPLAVAVLVAVKMLYVEDTLGDRLDVPGAEPTAT